MRMSVSAKNKLWGYLFILPSAVGIFIFYIIPFVMSLYYSLVTYGKFSGFNNYFELLGNSYFLLALKNTVLFTAIAIPLLLVTSFAIALFLNSFDKIASFFQSTLLIPMLIPTASVLFVWQIFLDEKGIINNILNALNLSQMNFYDSGFSMVVIILIFVWKNCGFCVILFTAGLSNMPKSVIESARLEGASSFKVVTKIIVPMMSPTTFFVFLMAIINSFKIFREIFLLFGDYPNENVYFLQNFINNNFYNLNYSQLSAASVILTIIIVAVLLVTFRIERKSNYLE